MKRLTILSMVVLALVLVATAGAAGRGQYLTPVAVEDLILDSNYALDHQIDDASCEGQGTPHADVVGAATYQAFRCEFFATIDNSFDGGNTNWCGYYVSVRMLRNGAFRVMSVPSYCMSRP